MANRQRPACTGSPARTGSPGGPDLDARKTICFLGSGVAPVRVEIPEKLFVS